MNEQPFSYTATIRLSDSNERGMLGQITTAIGDADGMIGAVDIVAKTVFESARTSGVAHRRQKPASQLA